MTAHSAQYPNRCSGASASNVPSGPKMVIATTNRATLASAMATVPGLSSSRYASLHTPRSVANLRFSPIG